MSRRIYVMPYVWGDGPFGRSQRPQYVNEFDMVGVSWMAIPFTPEPVALVTVDLPEAEHDALALLSAVSALPEDLDAKMDAGELADLRKLVGGFKIPLDLPDGSTGREVVARLGRIGVLMQKFNNRAGRSLFAVSKDSRVGDMPGEQRSHLLSIGRDVLTRPGAELSGDWDLVTRPDGSVQGISIRNDATIGAAITHLAQQHEPVALGPELF